MSHPSDHEHTAIQKTIDGVYAAISGPVGAPRDWDALRTLFTDDGRLSPLGAEDSTTSGNDIERYIERTEDYLVREGFHEIETGSHMEIFGDLAHVWSAYEGRTGDQNGPIVTRGINSFQLVKTGGTWKVFSVLWQQASDTLAIPADLSAKDEVRTGQ